jgi:hypothetical protein
MNDVFRKELRDLLPWIPVGMILIGALCWYVAPRSVAVYQSPELTFCTVVSLGCVLVALAMGLLQSAPDSRMEAMGYLLHRPVAMSHIFAAKLLAGALAYALSLIPGYAALAWYLENVGPEQLPANAAQLGPLIALSIATFAVHPAAMWSVWRDARWMGSKSFPVWAALLGVFASWQLISAQFQFWLLAVLIPGALTLWVAIAGALQAFRNEQFQPVADRQWPSVVGSFGLLCVCITLVTLTVIAGYSVVRRR